MKSIDAVEDENSELFHTEYLFQHQNFGFELSDELLKKLQQNINNLPSRQKEIIYLKFEEEMEYPEIAFILNISVESARKLLYRALVTLRKTIDPKFAQTLLLVYFKKNPDSVSMI